MAKTELGTKRTDPDTGKKFYDLNRDPVVSPYSGKSWPLSFFEESTAQAKMEQAEEEEVAEVDAENTEVELVSLEDADGDNSGDDIPDLGDDDDDVEIDDDDDTFLETDDEDDDDDMSGIIGVPGDDEEASFWALTSARLTGVMTAIFDAASPISCRERTARSSPARSSSSAIFSATASLSSGRPASRRALAVAL